MTVLNFEQRNRLCRIAKLSAPNEACGFILVNGEIAEIKNVSASPTSGFVMSTDDLTQLNPYDIQGIWHTHPRGTRHPSSTDLEAIKLGAIWPSWDYYIVTYNAVLWFDAKKYAPQENSFWDDFVSHVDEINKVLK